MAVFENSTLNDDWSQGLKNAVNNSQPIMAMYYVANIVDELETKLNLALVKLAALEKNVAPAAKKTETTKEVPKPTLNTQNIS